MTPARPFSPGAQDGGTRDRSRDHPLGPCKATFCWFMAAGAAPRGAGPGAPKSPGGLEPQSPRRCLHKDWDPELDEGRDPNLCPCHGTGSGSGSPRLPVQHHGSPKLGLGVLGAALGAPSSCRSPAVPRPPRWHRQRGAVTPAGAETEAGTRHLCRRWERPAVPSWHIRRDPGLPAQLSRVPGVGEGGGLPAPPRSPPHPLKWCRCPARVGVQGLCPLSVTEGLGGSSVPTLLGGDPKRRLKGLEGRTPLGDGGEVGSGSPCTPPTPTLGVMGASRDPQNCTERRTPRAGRAPSTLSPPHFPGWVWGKLGGPEPPEALTRPWQAGPSPPAPGSAARWF